MLFADIIVDISIKNLDKTFQYSVPSEMEKDIVIGSLVHIPFGNGNRTIKGYVVGLSDSPLLDISKIKSIVDIEKQVAVESHLLSLAGWIKENYGSTMNDAIKAVMPVRRGVKEKIVKTVFPLVDREEMEKFVLDFEKSTILQGQGC